MLCKSFIRLFLPAIVILCLSGYAYPAEWINSFDDKNISTFNEELRRLADDGASKAYISNELTSYVGIGTDQTITGTKTFSVFPVTPSSAPSANYEVANKKYVDDQVGGCVKTTGDQNVQGVKTFASFPITPSSAPTTDYQVANKKYVDDSVVGFTVSGTKVWDGGTDGDAPTAWSNLTLSSVIGSNVKLVMLQVINQDASSGATYYHFRQDGDTGDYDPGTASGGVQSCYCDQAGGNGIVMVLSNSSGVVEWIAKTSNVDTDVYVVGYFN